MDRNPTTRRFSRSMQEAFGPYTDNRLFAMDHEHTRPVNLHEKLLAYTCVLAIAVIVMVL